MRHLTIFLFVVGVASSALAAPTFFATANIYPGSGSTNDLAWQAAVGDFSEEDFDSLNPTYPLVLNDGYVSVEIRLAGMGGGSDPGLFAGSWGGAAAGSVYGTVYNTALLNSDGTSAPSSRIRLNFDQPVTGVGAWIYDDGASTAESVLLRVGEVGGTFTSSPLLESGNGLAHFVEGFVGVTSDVGITTVFFEVHDTQTGATAQRFFEIDHLQWGRPIPPIPVPGAILLGGIGVSLVSYLRRRGSL